MALTGYVDNTCRIALDNSHFKILKLNCLDTLILSSASIGRSKWQIQQ